MQDRGLASSELDSLSWDSNGGSLNGGVFMLIRNKQWPWFGIQVRTCREKSTNLLLENAGYECFLPVGKCRRHWSDRTKIMEVPLFPGYLFCRMNPNNRLPVLTTPGVIQIVGVGKTPIAIDEEEISAIQKAAMSGLPTMPWPYLRVGQTAYITEGPLKGLTGIIIRIKSGLKLVLSVNLLQRSVAVEMDSAWAIAPPATTSAPLHAVIE